MARCQLFLSTNADVDDRLRRSERGGVGQIFARLEDGEKVASCGLLTDGPVRALRGRLRPDTVPTEARTRRRPYCRHSSYFLTRQSLPNTYNHASTPFLPPSTQPPARW
uniref:Uncharacterized protein n=1 Tax=Plectus sambesii TaxID=2011161 RepID=A0A914XJU3_9BILA